MKAETTVREVRYRCANPKCGAEDTAKLFPNEPIPLAFNCWKCGGGRGMPVDEMASRHVGMFAAAEKVH